MSWFEILTGFQEQSHDQVREKLLVQGEYLVSSVNNRRMRHGEFTTPSLSSLRSAAAPSESKTGLKIRELVANVENLHQDPENANAVFQVASQFNCLEMAGPQLTPEDGVAIYQSDFTQGPACAVCAGAGTIFRNYFAPINGLIGQTVKNQIDCLAPLGKLLGNENRANWNMKNGYCLPSKQGLKNVCDQLAGRSDDELNELRAALCIGLHSQTEVTVGDLGHVVTQAFCSAMPVSYSRLKADAWQPFAQLVLDAAYEATFLVAIANREKTGCNKLFLTLLGGGAFGNKPDWILSAVMRSAKIFEAEDLEVSVVSYRRTNRALQAALAEL